MPSAYRSPSSTPSSPLPGRPRLERAPRAHHGLSVWGRDGRRLSSDAPRRWSPERRGRERDRPSPSVFAIPFTGLGSLRLTTDGLPNYDAGRKMALETGGYDEPADDDALPSAPERDQRVVWVSVYTAGDGGRYLVLDSAFTSLRARASHRGCPKEPASPVSLRRSCGTRP